MAIQVQARRQRQQTREEPKKDVLDQLLQGLQIAGGVTGLAVDYQQFQSLSENRDRLKTQDTVAAQQRTDVAEGVINPTQRAELASQGFVPTEEGDTSAVRFLEGPEKAPLFLKAGPTPAQVGIAEDRKLAAKAVAVANKEKLDQENADRLYDIGQDFSKDKTVMTAKDKFQTATLVGELLDKNEAVTDQVALRQVFRLSGDVGAIRENDLKDLGASPSAVAQAQLSFNKIIAGEVIRPEERQHLKEMSQMVKQLAARDINRVASDFSNKGAARIKGMNSDELLQFLNPAGQFSEEPFEFQPQQESFVGGQSQESGAHDALLDQILKERTSEAGGR